MFQITNSTYRFRKKKPQSKTTEIDDTFALGITQTNKQYLSTFRASQNFSVNMSAPKNPKILPKLQKALFTNNSLNAPHRYIHTPSDQSPISKYYIRKNLDSQQNRNIYFRSQKNKRFQRQSEVKLNGDLTFINQLQNDNIPKYFALNKKGKRPYNQDRYICKNGIQKFYFKNHLKKQNSNEEQIDLYAVFDGHGGSGCAQFLKDNFLNFLIRSKSLNLHPQESLKQSFSIAEEKFISICQTKKFSPQMSGACAIACIVTERKITVASVGDCRAIMFNKQYLCQMTKDHKPTDINQKMRIIRCGGKVFKQQMKINHFMGSNAKIISSTRIAPGNLNVSRTIGDIETKLKKYGGLPGMISPEPDIKTFQKQNYDILLLASDGLFEAFSNAQIQKLYFKLAQKQQKNHLSSSNLANKFLDALMDEALQKSTDNITIIVVPLIQQKAM